MGWNVNRFKPLTQQECKQHGLLYASVACNGLWSMPLARLVVRLCRLHGLWSMPPARSVVYAACTACCTSLPLATACGLCRLHGLLYASAACNGLWSMPLARPVVRLCRLQRPVVYAAARLVVRLCHLQRPVVYAACTACCTPLSLATACGTPLPLATA